MSRGPAVRQADIARVLKTLKDAGLEAASITIRAGGEVVIIPAPLTAKAAGQHLADPAANDLASFRARKNARRTAQGS